MANNKWYIFSHILEAVMPYNAMHASCVMQPPLRDNLSLNNDRIKLFRAIHATTVLDKAWAADLYDCIWYTNSSRRREFVYQIQIGCECFIGLKKWPILWVHWRSNFKNKHCLSRENQSWSLCKSGQTLSDLQTLIKHSFLLYFPRELLMIF
jgi:hypothetical protein